MTSSKFHMLLECSRRKEYLLRSNELSLKGIAIASATWYSILFSNPWAVVNSLALPIWNGDNEIPVVYNKKKKKREWKYFE